MKAAACGKDAQRRCDRAACWDKIRSIAPSLRVESAFAMTTPPAAQIPGFYHRKIGDIVVTAVSDGYLDGDVSVLRNIEPDDAMAMLKANFRPGRRTFVNGFVVRSKGRTALIETGSGDYLLPTAGKLMENVLAAGVDPNEIDTVLLTHMHPDHSAGLTNMEDALPQRLSVHVTPKLRILTWASMERIVKSAHFAS